MKKFFALMLCCLFVLTCSLTGCAGFSIDKVKYYNEVVAKVGDTKITRFELVNAYNSYGNQLGSDDAMKRHSIYSLIAKPYINMLKSTLSTH